MSRPGFMNQRLCRATTAILAPESAVPLTGTR